MTKNNQLIAALALSGLIGIAHADEKDELLKLRNTTVNLIKQLVKQGVLTDKMAQDMIEQAEADAGKQVAESKAAAAGGGAGMAAGAGAGAAAGAAESAQAAGQAGAVARGATSAAASAAREAVPADEVRVAYVPDFIKDEIKQQVRNELRAEVVGDVMQKAKEEQWGIPDALPEWTRRFKLSGDIRLREQSSLMASDNISLAQNMIGQDYLNYGAINGANGVPQVSPTSPNAYLNTTHDQNIGRERFRLGFDATVNDSVDAGIRLTTGNTQNPVSTNQTLGNTGYGYQFAVDRAFLRYTALDSSNFNWLTLMGGRTLNPFFTGGSEMVWDEDLSFEGAAATVRQHLGPSELPDEIGGKGPVIFGTAGIFPLQAQNPWTGLTSLQKWMFGGQAGIDWGFDNQDTLKAAAAFYDYQGIKGVINKSTTDNSCADSSQDITQSTPQYIQGGNSMVGLCTTAQGSSVYGMYGLASDYKILDINALYDMALFSPIHLRLAGDFAKNVGFNANKIYAYTGQSISNQTTGWQVKADLGWTRVEVPGNWSAFAAYRYLERDAVLSSYTDSDFHLGSTNVKGWIFGGNYGVMKNVWLSGRWMSADMITGPNYSMDILQLDINTRF
ncbi:MAG: putative porin [Methylococcales bacterium]|nr:putative porin [Methylococcales bacterium]